MCIIKFECCMLSGRGLCDELITRSEDSYRLWCVVECDPNFVNEEALTQWGAFAPKEKRIMRVEHVVQGGNSV